jgi:hypothetical protein
VAETGISDTLLDPRPGEFTTASVSFEPSGLITRPLMYPEDRRDPPPHASTMTGRTL